MLKNKFLNKLVVLTGPSAVGKDTIADELIKWLPLQKVITTTTRTIRRGEKRGVDYHFVSRERFEEMIKTNLLIEFIEYNGNYYGTQKRSLKQPLERNFVPLLIVDPTEALNIQYRNLEALTIFIKPASINDIKKRLTKRGGSLDEISERLKLAKEAIKQEPIFAYSIVNKEGKLDEAVKTIKKIIKNYLNL